MFRSLVFRPFRQINQHFKKAEQQFKDRKWEQALSSYRLAQTENPEYGPAKVGESKCLLGLSRAQEAENIAAKVDLNKLQKPQEKEDFLQLMGRLQLTQQKFEKAHEYFDKSLEFGTKQQSPGALFKLFCLSSMNKLSQYGKKLDEIIKKKEHKPFHLFEKGWMLFQNKSFQQAITQFNNAIKSGLDDHYLYFYRGSAYRMLGKVQEAEKDLRKSLDLDNTFMDSQLGLIDILLQKQEIPQAYDLCNKVLKIYPKTEFALFNRGVCLFRMQNYPEAEKEFSGLIEGGKKDTVNPYFYLYRGMARLNTGKIEEAIEDLHKKIELDPENPDNMDIYLNLSMYHLQKQEFDQALKILKRAEEIDSKEPELLHQKGNILAMQGKKEESLKLLKEAINLSPERLQYRHSLAACHLMAKDHKGAEKILKECLEIDKSHRDTYSKLAELYMHIGQKEKALEQTKICDTHTPNDPQNLFLRATILSDMGKNDEADLVFEKLMKANPTNFEFALGRAEIKIRQNDKAQAKKFLETAEKLAQVPEIKAEIRKKIKSL